MLDFICMGSVELSCEERETSEIIKIKKSICRELNPRLLAFQPGAFNHLANGTDVLLC